MSNRHRHNWVDIVLTLLTIVCVVTAASAYIAEYYKTSVALLVSAVALIIVIGVKEDNHGK